MGKGITMERADVLHEKLTADERSSLMLMDLGPLRRLIAGRQEERLIELGLAELVCGEPELLPAGRRARALLNISAPGPAVAARPSAATVTNL